jgi:hypothetical protein
LAGASTIMLTANSASTIAAKRQAAAKVITPKVESRTGRTCGAFPRGGPHTVTT